MLAGLRPLARSARSVSSRTPAPNSMEKIVLMLPSKNRFVMIHACRFAPVEPPMMLGSL